MGEVMKQMEDVKMTDQMFCELLVGEFRLEWGVVVVVIVGEGCVAQWGGNVSVSDAFKC